jgi:uncharacterized membrane protein YfcA
MIALGLIFGSLVGFSLGLTGGGGAIFAVPLLVYGLHLPTRDAVGVSLITVGATAVVGFVQRLRRCTVEIPTGLLFAVAGMATAPVGAWLSRQLPEAVLLVLFGALMLLIAARMWIKASRLEPSTACVPLDENARATCRRDPAGELHLTSRCALLLAAVGLMVGVLTGLFGVGGGFVIVPALLTFSGMGIERAIGTSLLVISLVSVSGIVSHFVGGDSVPAALVVWFLAGSLGGMLAGTAVGRRLAGRRLQQVFAMLIVAVGVFVIARNLNWD